METRGHNPETAREVVEAKPQREVVRAFIVQSAFHRDIAQHVRKRIASGEDAVAAIADTSFMQVILMEKGRESTKNPGQLLPVGGNIEGRETASEAVRREMQEETQTRAYKIADIGDMTYTHTPKKGTAQDVHVQYFVADIAPSDHAFALNPEEDKAHSFPHLTYQELTSLWSTGQIVHEGTQKPMLDSLWPTSVRDVQPNNIPTSFTPEQEANMWQMMRAVAAHMEEREYDKKTRVLEHMRALLSIKKQDIQNIDAQIHKKTALENHTDALDAWYRETLSQLRMYARADAEFVDVFVQAAEMANFEEEIAHAGTTEPEVALRFMMTLLDLDFERDTYLNLAKENPLLAPLAERVAAFSAEIHAAAGEKYGSTLSQQAVLDAFSGIDTLEREVGTEDTETFLRERFSDIFIGHEYQGEYMTDIGERLNRIHTFMDDMHREMRNFSSDELSVTELDLYDEVRNADLTSLFQYAVPTPRAHAYFKEESFDSAKKRGIVFEARRTLALLMLFAKFDAAYDAVIERRNQPIQRIITGAFPSSEQTVLIESWNSDEVLPNGMPAFRTQEILSRTDAAHGGKIIEKEVRTCTASDGSDYTLVTYDRTKARSSYYRKILVRGDMAPDVLTSDVYARSIVVSTGTPEHPYRSERIKKVLASYPISDVTGSVTKEVATKEFEDESVVFAIIEQIQVAAVAQQKEIRIIDFKPTPRPGEKLASGGAGGGSPLRLAKFYIEYVPPTGKRTREEIQIFTPSIDPDTGRVDVDAFAYEQQKKDDDHSYAVQRLLQTQGLRSVVELLWPHRIYGDVFRQVHNKKKKKGAIRTRKGSV